MRKSFSRGYMFLTGMALVALVAALPVYSQDKAPKDSPYFSSFITLMTDDEFQKKLDVIDEYVKAGDWKEALGPLQALLDREEDVFVPIWVKGTEGKKTVRWTSGWDEANRLLGAMPAKALEFYEAESGGRARALLDAARKQG